MKDIFKLYFKCEIKKNILIFVLGIALIFGFKLLFVFLSDFSLFGDIDRGLQALDGAADTKEEEELVDRYIARQYEKLSEANLNSEQHIREELRISSLYISLTESLTVQRKSEELIQNAKTGEGISLSIPTDKYFDNLDLFKSISAPIKPLNQSSWTLYMNLQNTSLVPILVMFIVCALWGKFFEYGIYRSEKIAYMGRKYGICRFLLSYGITVMLWLVSFVFDIFLCGVWHGSDAAIQSVKAFSECTLNVSVGGFLFILGLLQLFNTTVCFGAFYLICRLRKDLKKAVTVSAFAIMAAYILKSSYPDALAPVLFGICNYTDIFGVLF